MFRGDVRDPPESLPRREPSPGRASDDVPPPAHFPDVPPALPRWHAPASQQGGPRSLPSLTTLCPHTCALGDDRLPPSRRGRWFPTRVLARYALPLPGSARGTAPLQARPASNHPSPTTRQ